MGLLVLVLVIAWLAGFFTTKIEPTTGPPADRPVRLLAGQATDTVQEIDQQTFVEAVGSLRSASRTVISSKLLATILQIAVTAGDEVVANQVLVQLDTEEAVARLRQAEESRQAAQAARSQAEADFQRAENLRRADPGAIAQQEYDSKQARLQIATAQLRRAQQAVTEATVLISYGTIRAPQAGRIVDRLAEPGDMAKPGEPLLVVYDALSLRLEAPVMESLAGKLQLGQKLSVHIDALARDFQATVDEIVPQATAARSFLVKAKLPRTNNLYEGMFGRLKVPTGTRRHLCLNENAIYRIGQLECVDTVGPGDVLQRRLIKTGHQQKPGRVEVLSGLRAGERVVLRSQITTPPAAPNP
ncbi:MAG: efflux RND transporter periplasmic adaptor subunit [Planctomycetales bacterium]|nr:efflux RND transporter periplasmic adaptor subunit [Planctomycetales bacterium]NIM08833.1 efflux RND transporter periplasmic adaptor subunit [Planctomycetales bacterium]NIN08294.1 efflux RND transporter periplasmic adaptor subunit [Planctomycetales bacterium]NIN77423.1 efflux RND transporter periplasmic adaptor subunit [Planctomycetales bacterium]NIO34597.1 efflux RND transporter periplasmic adaptor subunit [Planctomycetales bacterium]